MKYITDDALKVAFITMMNKLIFACKKMLTPMFRNLQGYYDKEYLSQMKKAEHLITALCSISMKWALSRK